MQTFFMDENMRGNLDSFAFLSVETQNEVEMFALVRVQCRACIEGLCRYD
jgi:hypothetical protein